MLETQKKRSLRSLTGFLIILLIYTVLTLTAAFLYPKGFNPLTQTLGQLGDPLLNKSGAIFYKIGVCIVCGTTFFIDIALLIAPKQWLNSRGAPRRKILFYLTVTFMFLFTLFVLLTTFIPGSADYALNSLLTLLFLTSLELFFVSSALGIRRLKDHLIWVPSFGFAAVIINLLLVVASVVTGLSFFSWFIAILSWSYTAAFIYEFSNAHV